MNRTWIQIATVCLCCSCGVADRLSVLDDEVVPVPRLKFVSPGSTSISASDAATIQVQFADTSSGDTWSLFYLSNVADVRGEAIFENASVPGDTSTSYTWNTSDLTPGDYYVYAEMISGNRVATAAATSPISISHSGEDNANPAISLGSPNGGTAYEIGDTISITWTASDADGDTLTFDIEYSNDSGTTWNDLDSGLTASPYSWELTEDLTAGNNYRIRVTARDTGGGSASAISANDFIVTLPITWNNTIAQMMLDSCGGSACHSTGGDYADTFDSDVYSNDAGTGVSQKTTRVYIRAISIGNMPPAGSGYPALTDEQQTQFINWVNEGVRED